MCLFAFGEHIDASYGELEHAEPVRVRGVDIGAAIQQQAHLACSPEHCGSV
jgi:hypothetical protein